MPVIPKYERQVEPAVIQDRTAGLVERQMTESAGQLGELVNAFDKAQRLAQYNEGVVKLTQGLAEIKDKYKNDTDFYSIHDRAKKDLEDLKQGIITATPNPQVGEALGQEFDQKAAFAFSDIRDLADKGVISDVKAKSFAALEARGKAYLAADNENERQHERQRIEETIQAMVKGGIVTPVEGEAIREKTHAELEKGQVFADMERVGPEVVLKLLKQGEYDLDPETKFALERTVELESQRQKAAANPEEGHTNPVAYAVIKQALENGQAGIKEILTMPGLSNGDRIKLIDGQDLWKDRWYKNTEAYFKQVLGWQDMIGAFGDPSAASHYYDAINELEQAIKAKNLTGAAIYEEGKKIIPHYLQQYGEEAAKETIQAKPGLIQQFRGSTIVPLAEKIGVPWWVVGTKPYAEQKKALKGPAVPQRQEGETWEQYQARIKAGGK